MAKTKDNKVKVTPLMKQYNAIKAKHPTALLLFRVGDFYETFGEDAIKASKILGITLTKRANGKGTFIELAGFPHHSVETYLPKLVRAGQKVAVCDQLEDPKMTKTIVKRGVTELVTPGIAYNDKVLDYKENNFLASVHLDGKNAGIAFLDISTGEYFVAQGNLEYIDKLLQSFLPSEVVVRRDLRNKFQEIFGDKYYMTTFEDWVFSYDFAYELLNKHFATNSLKGFGIEQMNDAIIAAGAVLHYLSETKHDKINHITKISRIEADRYVWLDRFTIRNLELLSASHIDATSLLDVIDETKSPMGARLIRRWVVLPLKDKIQIEERLNIVDHFFNNPQREDEISSLVKTVGDLERLISKVSIAKVNPRELIQLNVALETIPVFKKLLKSTDIAALERMAEQLNPCNTMHEKIIKTINPESPVMVNKGDVILAGVNQELDDLRYITTSSKEILNNIKERETENTGIPSLKIGFNNVFGYYLEVTKLHISKVPEDWIRKQTLTNYERYITPELKELEGKILGAQEKILALETRLYNELVSSFIEYIEPIQLNASIIARLDVLSCFARTAQAANYVRPRINEGFAIDIKNGRHPVIERNLPLDEPYVANDVYLDNEKQQMIMLTGPNMSGKSALLRQTALIVLLAQMGSFVPADAADIGLVDKVFTRVGASDNISSGESTFMVEMNETASILNNISNRSLILLDEIGRGTSTYDGISIAWSISEFLHEHKAYKAKVLFATHYHELNEMAGIFNRIKNYHVSVKEVRNKIIFLRKLAKGGSEHSFGIHVAKMAGMPKVVLKRSEEILKQLEAAHSNNDLGAEIKEVARKKVAEDNYQLSFIQLDDPLLEQIKEDILNTDINTLTPVEALMKLNEIKNLLKGN
ncbi:MAG: DNA mismatch repair protein MutS [Bacteroidetes bacterium 4572_112]|nr:MAG: DNA mismatch repair protein MutS [Bacteroidetes bacterium 4572_112]